MLLQERHAEEEERAPQPFSSSILSQPERERRAEGEEGAVRPPSSLLLREELDETVAEPPFIPLRLQVGRVEREDEEGSASTTALLAPPKQNGMEQGEAEPEGRECKEIEARLEQAEERSEGRNEGRSARHGGRMQLGRRGQGVRLSRGLDRSARLTKSREVKREDGEVHEMGNRDKGRREVDAAVDAKCDEETLLCPLEHEATLSGEESAKGPTVRVMEKEGSTLSARQDEALIPLPAQHLSTERADGSQAELQAPSRQAVFSALGSQVDVPAPSSAMGSHADVPVMSPSHIDSQLAPSPLSSKPASCHSMSSKVSLDESVNTTSTSSCSVRSGSLLTVSGYATASSCSIGSGAPLHTRTCSMDSTMAVTGGGLNCKQTDGQNCSIDSKASATIASDIDLPITATEPSSDGELSDSCGRASHSSGLLVVVGDRMCAEAEAAEAAEAEVAVAAKTAEAVDVGVRKDPSASQTSAGSVVDAGFSLPLCTASEPLKHSWGRIDASAFRVRCGPNYRKTGAKAPSLPALGEVVAMDCLHTPRKVHHLLSYGRIRLPVPSPGWSETYPEFLVVNQMLPAHMKHSLFTSESSDGETMNLLTYVRLPPGLGAGWEPESGAAPVGGEQLLKRFLLKAETDPEVGAALKEIGRFANMDELAPTLPRALASLMRKFNGKPILTAPEQKFYTGKDNAYFQVDLDGHRYNYATRAAHSKVMMWLKRMHLDYGICIEARTDVEMPEVMAFACRLHRLSPERAVQFAPALKGCYDSAGRPF